MRAVVFVLRGCPVRWLGAYGNELIGTPHLDRLAAESIVFDRHISDCPESRAASRVWLGDTSPTGSRLVDALSSSGIRSVIVRANHPDTDAPDWFYAGWDEVFDTRPQQEDESPLDALLHSIPTLLDRLVEEPQFLLWIEIDRLLPPWDVRQEVFEAYLGNDDEESEDESMSEMNREEREPVEADDEDEQAESEEGDELGKVDPESDAPDEPVSPWTDPPTGEFDNNDPDAREWLHSSFAAVVTSLDAELGAVFDELRVRGLDKSAAWLLTSDFGYPLGEHGQIGLHRPWLYEELVHLPLILRLPDAAEACRRVPGFTQPPDIAPTLLDLFGVKPSQEISGSSLLALSRGEVATIREHAVTTLELNTAAERAIRTNEWAYLLPIRVPEGEKREPQLFEKPDDRWEVNDLRMRNIERADELETELRKQV